MIRERDFKGMAPRRHPSLLPPGFAQTARNVKMRSGALDAWRASSFTDSVAAGSNVIGFLEGSWRGFAEPTTSFVQGAVDTNRVYIADGVSPPRLKNYGTYDYALALPAPNARIASVTHSSGTIDPDASENIAFVYTNVTSLGEESAPSPLSFSKEASEGNTITLTGFEALPAGRGVTHRRIYRTVANSAAQVNLYLIEDNTTADPYVYTVDDDIEEAITSRDFNTPRDTLMNLTAMPNGMVAGSAGSRRLCFCEPYQPHAWPRKYEIYTDHDIIGLAAFGGSLVVLTKGVPYIVTGSHPSTLTMVKSEEQLPCLSARGIVNLGYAAAYPSSEGLVLVSEQGAKLVTQELFTREAWLDLNPESFRAALYEGCYVFSHEPVSGDPQSGVIDLRGDMPWYSTVSEVYRHLVSGRGTQGSIWGLATDGVSVRALDKDNKLTYTWRSRRFRAPVPVNMGWAITMTDGTGSVTSRLYAGTSMSLVGSHAEENDFARMPSGRLDNEFEIELEGTAAVSLVAFGMDPAGMIE